MNAGAMKFILLCVSGTTLCVTILFSFLFLALWEYKLWVGISLLVILLVSAFSLCVVALRASTPRHIPPLKQERLTTYDNQPYS